MIDGNKCLIPNDYISIINSYNFDSNQDQIYISDSSTITANLILKNENHPKLFNLLQNAITILDNISENSYPFPYLYLDYKFQANISIPNNSFYFSINSTILTKNIPVNTTKMLLFTGFISRTTNTNKFVYCNGNINLAVIEVSNQIGFNFVLSNAI